MQRLDTRVNLFLREMHILASMKSFRHSASSVPAEFIIDSRIVRNLKKKIVVSMKSGEARVRSNIKDRSFGKGLSYKWKRLRYLSAWSL